MISTAPRVFNSLLDSKSGSPRTPNAPAPSPAARTHHSFFDDDDWSDQSGGGSGGGDILLADPDDDDDAGSDDDGDPVIDLVPEGYDAGLDPVGSGGKGGCRNRRTARVGHAGSRGEVYFRDVPRRAAAADQWRAAISARLPTSSGARAIAQPVPSGRGEGEHAACGAEIASDYRRSASRRGGSARSRRRRRGRKCSLSSSSIPHSIPNVPFTWLSRRTTAHTSISLWSMRHRRCRASPTRSTRSGKLSPTSSVSS
jgi:hypothetical protein